MTMRQDAQGNQAEGHDRNQAKHESGTDALENCRTNEAANHCPTPIRHQEVCRLCFGQVCYRRQPHKTDEQAADGDLRTDVSKKAEGACEQPWMFPYAAGQRGYVGELFWAKTSRKPGGVLLRLELDQT